MSNIYINLPDTISTLLSEAELKYFCLLLFLDLRKKNITIRQSANFMGVDIQSIKRIIKKLRSKKLISRQLFWDNSIRTRYKLARTKINYKTLYKDYKSTIKIPAALIYILDYKPLATFIDIFKLLKNREEIELKKANYDKYSLQLLIDLGILKEKKIGGNRPSTYIDCLDDYLTNLPKNWLRELIKSWSTRDIKIISEDRIKKFFEGAELKKINNIYWIIWPNKQIPYRQVEFLTKNYRIKEQYITDYWREDKDAVCHKLL